MEPDIRMIDSYQYDIKDIDKNIDLEASKLKGIGMQIFQPQSSYF